MTKVERLLEDIRDKLGWIAFWCFIMVALNMCSKSADREEKIIELLKEIKHKE